MAADGSKGSSITTTEQIEWSTDKTVLEMQEIAYGYGPADTPYIVDRMFIQLPWFGETKTSIERALRMTSGARKENNVPCQGPSRAGKTSVCRALMRAHMPWRDRAGLHIPWGYMRVPAIPSVSVFGQEMLRALGDPTWQHRRSPAERLARIGEVAEMVGLKTLLVDDLHHLVDSRGSRVQHAVADLLIDIGNETDAPFVFFGLERMREVFNVNEQLRGRTIAPVECLRLDWRDKGQRTLFSDALEKSIVAFRTKMSMDKTIDDPTFVFRLYCSCGGLIGYLVLIFRVAEDLCQRKSTSLGFDVLRKSVAIVVGKAGTWPGHRDPFHSEFVAEPTDKTLCIARAVGSESGPGVRNSVQKSNKK